MFGTCRQGLLLVAMVLACTSAGPQSESEPEVDASTLEPAAPSKSHDSAALVEARAFFKLPELAYARAFAINVHTEYAYHEDLLVDDLGQLNPDRVPEAGALLSDAQLIVLTDIVSGADADHMGPAYCFYPHHAIALYDAEGEILGELTFCFMCGRMKASFEGLGPDAKFESLRFLLEDLQVPLDLPLAGLPPSLARPIVKQDVELRLGQCDRSSLRKPGKGQPWRTHGRPPLRFDVHVDESGAITEVVGLDERSVVSACLAKALLGKKFSPAQTGSVHRFEFRPQAPQPLRSYERPL